MADEINTLEDLADASICVLSGTTTELNLTSVFNARGIPFTPVVFEDNTQLRPAYEEGQCEAWTSDASQLAAFKATIEDEGGAAQEEEGGAAKEEEEETGVSASGHCHVCQQKTSTQCQSQLHFYIAAAANISVCFNII